MSNAADPPFTTSRRGLLPNGPVCGRAVSYSGAVKVRVCRALYDDWRDLTDYLGIPAHDRARFAQGHEASCVWDWLESHGRLGELADALQELGLSHCARMLQEH